MNAKLILLSISLLGLTSGFILTKENNADRDEITSHVNDDSEVPCAKIGTQTWTTSNLDVDQFLNGEPILEAKSFETWKECVKYKIPCYAYYNFDKASYGKYGKMYNHYCAINANQIAPEGYRIPTMDDWKTLVNYLGGYKKAAFEMRTKDGWSNSGNTNSSKFSATPGGKLISSFSNEGKAISYWNYLQQENGITLPKSLDITSEKQIYFFQPTFGLDVGQYIRCVKI